MYWGGSSAGWLFWKLFHTSDIYVVSHLCGSSCVCPGWSVLDRCSYTVHTGKSSSHLDTQKEKTSSFKTVKIYISSGLYSESRSFTVTFRYLGSYRVNLKDVMKVLPFFLILVGLGGFMLPTTFSAFTSDSCPSCWSSSKSYTETSISRSPSA